MYSFLLFRCYENVFEEEKNKNNEGNNRDFTTVERDRNDETHGFDLAFDG